jgi:ABC-2 type transport system ATP-binding protein
MAVIDARALVKVFRRPFRRGGVRAVAGLDLDVAKGRIFGLLGPNGSGKTTTILMLLGLLKPTSGQALVLGHPAGHKEARRRTGFLPEETRLYEFLTGAETLQFVGRLFGLGRAERNRRTDELLERTGMREARDRRLATYSKGMARRIGLAQALIARPELLVLDEPTSGLDPVGNREVRDLLREVAAAGTTILLTSHILSDVADVCDEVAIVHQGRKILTGEVSTLLADAKRLVWETDAVDEGRHAAIVARLEAEGVRLYGVRPPRTTLEVLFLDALARDQADVGGA